MPQQPNGAGGPDQGGSRPDPGHRASRLAWLLVGLVLVGLVVVGLTLDGAVPWLLELIEALANQ